MVEINNGARFRWGMRWTEEGDGYDTRAHLISEATDIPGRDPSSPGLPDRFRVYFRPGSYSSGYKQPEFGVGSTNLGFEIHFFLEKKEQLHTHVHDSPALSAASPSHSVSTSEEIEFQREKK
jgi:hypothetical protein